ncbi:MAG TPA: uroporphyrinogen decarboxylase family protein [Thermomicrobiaceae bacterium]|nr:uroporphyrinogen decarboxylase family protein [Thermomicrobiaceae bacterium]
MAGMSAWERVEAALAGEAPDRAPVSLWRHFPNQDQTAEALADVSVDWQRRFDFDFVKLMPPGDYATIDWGAESEYRGSPGGTRQTTRFPVTTVDDWRRIRQVPIDRGRNREVIEAARLVNERLGGSVPVLQTIFSPLTVAMKLSDGAVIGHLRERPEVVHEALEAIAAVTAAMLAVSLERGASGIFFATQCASTDLLTPEEYRAFGTRYDLPVLEGAAASRFTLLHIHGDHVMFDELMGYPVQALNWHDQRTPPSLAEGEARSGKCVVGGIDEKAVVTMAPRAAADQARDAVEALNGRHVMVAPGCVIPVATPEANVRAIVDAVRG